MNDLGVEIPGGFLRHIRLAGIDTEHTVLGQDIQPVRLHGLGGPRLVQLHKKTAEHFTVLHVAGSLTGLAGQFRFMEKKQLHRIDTWFQQHNGLRCHQGRVSQHKENAVRMVADDLHRPGGQGACQRKNPGKAARVLGCGDRCIQALGIRDGHVAPGGIPVALRLDAGRAVDEGIKPQIDAHIADDFLPHFLHQAADQPVIQAVGALQELLGIVKKTLLRFLFGQDGTHIHIIAQLTKPVAADILHRPMAQGDGKTAGTFQIGFHGRRLFPTGIH